MSVCHLCGRCLWKPEVIVLLELELQTACEPPGLNAGSWSFGRASSAPNHKPGSPSLIPKTIVKVERENELYRVVL